MRIWVMPCPVRRRLKTQGLRESVVMAVGSASDGGGGDSPARKDSGRIAIHLEWFFELQQHFVAFLL